MRNTDPDLLYGITAIASALSVRPKHAEHLHDVGKIPTFKIGATVCARRSSLTAWLADCEAKARAAWAQS